MINYKKEKKLAIPEQNLEIDPRSKTTADGSFNLIATGDKELKFRGTKRMLAEKKKKLLGTNLCG